MGKNTIEPEKTTYVHRHCCTELSTKQTMVMILPEVKGVNLLEFQRIIRAVRRDFPYIDLSEVKIISHEIKGVPGYMGVKFKIEGKVPPTYLEIGRS